jgi:hypothetical protein
MSARPAWKPRILTLGAVLLAGCAAVAVGCGPTFTRGSDDPTIDEPPMSTRLDRKDLDIALEQWITGFQASPFMVTLPRGKPLPSIAILKIANDTSEHIGGALDNLLSEMETKLVDSGAWTVVDNSRLTTDANMAERLRQLGDTVDPETRVALGKEYGIHYFVNGRVGETTEEVQDTRRVQYYLFLRVTDVATNVIRYQDQVDITKQVED